MTNQEWLGTLSPDTWWEVVWNYGIRNFGARYTDTRLAVIDWLKQEHEPIKEQDTVYLCAQCKNDSCKNHGMDNIGPIS